MAVTHFQTIVVGAGGLGSATAYWLGKRGLQDVLVLEQFELGHNRGGSEDHSRVIRHSYHDNVYGRLTQASYDNWAALEAASGQQLVFKAGGIDLAAKGTPGARSVLTYRQVMADNGHEFEVLTTDQVMERYPQFNLTEEVEATFQKETGLVDIRRACQTHIALAEGYGVTFKPNSPVRRIEDTADLVRVFTDEETFTADNVVVCTGSWTDEILGPLGQTWKTTISQEQVVYLATPNVRDFSIGNFPVWVYHTDNLFYGFPVYGEVAIKVARDMTGNFVTQQTRTMEPIEPETKQLTDFVGQLLPGGLGRELYSKTCVYDMTPDRDFIIDRMPGHPRIILGSGAGHAAKFAGLFGEMLSEIAVEGNTRYPVDAFKADRPALTDPAFRPVFDLKG